MSASPVAGPSPSNVALVTRRVVGRRTVLTVAGELDLDAAPLLADAVDDALEAGALELWLDFSPTEFMDSSGLHLLIETQNRLETLSRRLAVICPPGPVRRLVDLAGMTERLPLYHDRAAAHRAT
jgi:anti-sigma B factor antagonist